MSKVIWGHQWPKCENLVNMIYQEGKLVLMSYMAVKCPTFNLKQVMFVSFSGGQRSFELTRVKL